MHNGRFWPASANEYRPEVMGRREDERAHGDLVRRREHRKAGKRAGQSHVLDAHLGWAVLADRDAAMRAYHLQIDIRESRGHAQLLESLVHGEAGETGSKGNFATRGQA